MPPRCAVGLSRRTRDWLAALPATIATRIGFKIGAHFGTIVASRLGGRNQQITATGDTVNVASRLMEVAADHGAELAVSDEMLQAAGRDSALFKAGVLTGPIETQIRGRTGSLPVWLWREDGLRSFGATAPSVDGRQIACTRFGLRLAGTAFCATSVRWTLGAALEHSRS